MWAQGGRVDEGTGEDCTLIYLRIFGFSISTIM
jgi:hypothetical protein